MPNIKLKVCGLRDNADEVLTKIKPDYAGFIFYEKSPRYIANFDLNQLDAEVKKVGVFVNSNFQFIKQQVDKFNLHMVQLHGGESVELCKKLKPIVKVTKVFSGNKPLDLEVLNSFEPHIDFFLFDTRSEQFGGTGKPFDWSKLVGMNIGKPMILSGGIGVDELEQIRNIENLNIYAIDVNSKFEISPGLKDVDLLKRFKEKL